MLIRAAVLGLLLMLVTASCDEVTKNVATSGPKRYKAEVSSLLLEMKAEIESSGAASDRTYKKLEGIVEKWKTEMGAKQSYINLTDMKKHIDAARAEPGKAFQSYREAGLMLTRTLDTLKTEVQ